MTKTQELLWNKAGLFIACKLTQAQMVNEMENMVKGILTEYTDFVVKNSYCDSDVYSEGKTAIDQFCEINLKHKK